MRYLPRRHCETCKRSEAGRGNPVQQFLFKLHSGLLRRCTPRNDENHLCNSVRVF